MSMSNGYVFVKLKLHLGIFYQSKPPGGGVIVLAEPAEIYKHPLI